MSKNNYEPTRHHIIPRSRGGSGLENNISMVPDRDHNVYHQLFENRTPDEIVKYLNSYFWANKYQITIRKA